MASAHLIERTWLKRVFEVSLDDTEQCSFTVAYQGRGLGIESVVVDGAVAARYGTYLWFVPHLPFRISGRDAEIDVRVWPWLAIRSFRLSVDGDVLYTEGG